jgi:prepilin-type N-terminal cleavage/methylation domain-containing protein
MPIVCKSTFMKPINQNTRRIISGFSLVEILVVLVIASILTAVTLGGYSAMRASNNRTSCQANMSQIYRAIRMYAADYNGSVPYYNPAGVSNGVTGQGIGLWALYTYGIGDVPADAGVKPEKRYLSNPKLFHCPGDIADDHTQMFTDSANSVYNPDYLSYQTSDSGCPDPGDTACGTSDGQYGTALYTYNPIQTIDVSDGTLWQRQLLTFDGSVLISRPPTDNTVIFWCPFHRGHGSASTDNVLFWDGTVQSLPEDQDGKTGAQRTPKSQ